MKKKRYYVALIRKDGTSYLEEFDSFYVAEFTLNQYIEFGFNGLIFEL